MGTLEGSTGEDDKDGGADMDADDDILLLRNACTLLPPIEGSGPADPDDDDDGDPNPMLDKRAEVKLFAFPCLSTTLSAEVGVLDPCPPPSAPLMSVVLRFATDLPTNHLYRLLTGLKFTWNESRRAARQTDEGNDKYDDNDNLAYYTQLT